MKKVRRDAVIEEMISHSRIEASRHLIHQSPLDAHHARKDDIADAKSDKRRNVYVAVDEVVKGRYDMPDTKEQCLEKQRGR